MTDKYKGIIEIDILGAKRGFKFGIRAMSLFCEAQSITLKEAEAFLRTIAENNDMERMISFYHSGAVAYARLMKQPEPTIDDVWAWVEEVGVGFLEEKIIEVHKVPNEVAP